MRKTVSLLCATSRSTTLLFVLGLGCTGQITDESYDANWGSDEVASAGKADGLLDTATALAFDNEATGSISGGQLDLYQLQLQRGDKIEVTMRATSGNLSPHAGLFLGTHSHIASKSFTANGPLLTKHFEVEISGQYALVARAFKNQGSGNYQLSYTCQAGPCKGDFPPAEDMGIEDVALCIAQARACSIAALPAAGDTVGPARAGSIFGKCLGEVSVGGESCSQACDESLGASLCATVINVLPFFADQSVTCHEAFNGCMESCSSLGEDRSDAPEDLSETTESTCLDTGLNGNCIGYAQGLTTCSGKLYAPDTGTECQESCEATSGAWTDDTSDLCDCDTNCSVAEEECNEICSGDEECVQTCVEHRNC